LLVHGSGREDLGERKRRGKEERRFRKRREDSKNETSEEFGM
jgi:hypothetical protein